jgi:mono/diheme cytochrome c family protein
MKMRLLLIVACAALGLLSSCRRDMAQQAKYKPLQAATFFENGMASRPLPPHTIPRGQLREDELYFTGRLNGQLANVFPETVTRAMLERGRERFDIYCAVCHGASGKGDGMIVRRGFPAPPSLHLDRLRTAPAGHFYDVITSGFGVMYPYAARVAPADRWAIAAYIRALQLSQNSTLADVEPAEKAQLEALPK